MTAPERKCDEMGARELARAAGISPSTASRVKRGNVDNLDMATARAVLPYLYECPCCRAIPVSDASGPTLTPDEVMQVRQALRLTAITARQLGATEMELSDATAALAILDGKGAPDADK